MLWYILPRALNRRVQQLHERKNRVSVRVCDQERVFLSGLFKPLEMVWV
jgi:hypothetical protein